MVQQGAVEGVEGGVYGVDGAAYWRYIEGSAMVLRLYIIVNIV